MKIGTVTAACGPSYEGTIRYNSTSKVNEYCDETNWTTMGSATSTFLIWTGPDSGTQDMSASTTKAFTTTGSYSIIVTKTMTLTFRGAAGGGGAAFTGVSGAYGGGGGGGGGNQLDDFYDFSIPTPAAGGAGGAGAGVFYFVSAP